MEGCQGFPERVLSSFFILSLLSKKKNVEDRVKKAVERHAPSFNIHDAREVRGALVEALARISRQDLAPLLTREKEWRRASESAEKWFADGISIVSDEISLSPAMRRKLGDRIVLGVGNRLAASDKRAAMLCSRQPRRIAPNAPFLTAAASAAQFVMATGHTLVSSYGTAGYNAVNCLTHGRPVIIVCPDALPHMNGAAALAKFLDAYDGLIDPANTLFVSSVLPGTSARRQDAMRERDELVAAVATLICAAEMREGGNVHRIVQEARKEGVPVRVFSASDAADHPPTRVVPARPTAPNQPTIGAPTDDMFGRGPVNKSSEIAPIKPLDHAPVSADPQSILPSYLYHYTRACPGPWPGQTQAQYWRSLLHDEPHAAHSAFDTLCRILEEKLIRAASRFIRGKEDVVCFSELPPARLSSLWRWRRGLTRWAVEPYGIGIELATLCDYGAKPVQYGTDEDFAKLPAEQKYLFQAQRGGYLLWDVEREWRVKGNVDLSLVPTERIVVVAADLADKELIESRFGLRTVVVGDLSLSMSQEDLSFTSRANVRARRGGLGARAL
ncbi:MAG: hypothetical protein ACP5M0_03805 [Desulfomonilaceae bacterium]